MSVEKVKRVKERRRYHCDICHENTSDQNHMFERKNVSKIHDAEDEHVCRSCLRKVHNLPSMIDDFSAKFVTEVKRADCIIQRIDKIETVACSVDALARLRKRVDEIKEKESGECNCDTAKLEKENKSLKAAYKRLMKRVQVLENK